ncbi:MAG: hypothetical protein H7067_10035 [Burkholderiales bacterium]|nr:hypothetical protein [Opitutaceae bacterium]
MFEHRSRKLLPRREFYHRLARSFIVGAALIAFSLSLGMSGYHWLGGLAWIDAFLNAAMILSGMGPVNALTTSGAKFFAACYAIYCGIALVTTAAVILSPVIHRALHKFHLEDDSSQD